MWGRWDAMWYLNLAREGYVVRGDISQVQSNLAFFPLYPYLIRLVLWPIPDRLTTPGVELAAAVLVSNVMLVGGLILLHRWVWALTDNRETAQRTVLYLLLFPTGFILSCAYTEATFLFFVATAFYAATRRSWGWAGVAALGAGLTRPLGIFLVPALLWLYLDSVQWRRRAIHANVLWIVAAPLGLLAHFSYLYILTGDFFAALTNQGAWDKQAAWPWTTLVAPINYNLLSGPTEQITTLLFLTAAVVACWRLPSAAYGLFALSQILPSLLTATLSSQVRYNMLAVVPFVLLAQWGRYRQVDQLIQIVFFALQVLFMVAWSQFYWVT